MQVLSPGRAFWSLWFVLLLLKLWLAQRLPLFGDEAWYWLEGQHLDWAYSDLPPLTAWLVRFGVETAGPSVLGVRWPFLALAQAVPLLLRAAATRRFGRMEGDLAGVLALLLPLLGGAGFLALPDVPLTFAFALCLLAGLRLVQAVDGPGVAWLAAGLVLGALSHYRFAPLAGAGLLGLLLESGGRRALRDWRVWAALFAGLLAWTPLLVWNLAHANAGLAFQLAERHPWSLHAEGAWLPLAQLLVVSPLLLLLLLATLARAWRGWRAAEPGSGLLFATSAVPLAGYVLLGFFADRERVTFHWLLQAWLPLLVAAPVAWREWRPAWRRAAVLFAVLCQSVILGYACVASLPVLRADWADSRWYPDNFAGWHEIASELQSRVDVVAGRTELVADNFMLGAQLAFALQRPGLRVLDHPLNHKHGRAAQLALWQAKRPAGGGLDGAVLLVMEDTALPLRARLAHYRRRCAELRGWSDAGQLAVDHGRKRFLLFALEPVGSATCVLPAMAWIDAPLPGATSPALLDVAGWAFKDGAGIAQVEITLDGRVVAPARYGLPAPHVADYWRGTTDTAHPDVGFHARVDLSDVAPGAHWLGLRLRGRDGEVEHGAEQRIRLAD